MSRTLPEAAAHDAAPPPIRRRESSAGFTLEMPAPDRWSLSGDLDSMSSSILVRAAEAAGTAVPVLYLDCSRVDFIDLAGWRALALLRQVFHPITDLRLCHPSPAVQRIISILGHP